jgi:methylated-DNA-[protein]-cysteine S-methyltransferase
LNFSFKYLANRFQDFSVIWIHVFIHNESPIGKIINKATENEVHSIHFIEQDENENPNQISDLAQSQLREYFEGKRKNFHFPMNQSGSDFQKNVRLELQNIPLGHSISYAILAKRMQNPLAIRAICGS